MDKVWVKPHLFSKFNKIGETDDFEIYEFIPSIVKAFPFKLEKISIPYRLRCAQEYFVGYKVFYVRKNGLWGGYCIVSNGRNSRYKFCTEKDITFGRYYIVPELRGQGLALRMIHWVLNSAGLKYQEAYAYVHAGNKASHATLEKLGATPIGHFNKVGKFRRIIMNDNGMYTLYKYRKEVSV